MDGKWDERKKQKNEYVEDWINESMSDDDDDDDDGGGGWGFIGVYQSQRVSKPAKKINVQMCLNSRAEHLEKRWRVGLELPTHESWSCGIAYFNSPSIVVSE